MLKYIIIILSISILILDYSIYDYGLSKIQYYKLPFGFRTEYSGWPLCFNITDKYGFIKFGSTLLSGHELRISKTKRYAYNDTLLIAEVIDTEGTTHFIKYFESKDPKKDYEVIETKSIDESKNYKWINLQDIDDKKLFRYRALTSLLIIIDIILIYIYLRKRKFKDRK